jgi:hypothetical protein
MSVEPVILTFVNRPSGLRREKEPAAAPKA